HQIDARAEHLLIGVETDEGRLGDGKAVLMFAGHFALKALGAVLEYVGDRGNLDVRVAVEGVDGSAGAPAAAADNADLDGVVRRGKAAARREHRRRADSAGGQEISTSRFRHDKSSGEILVGWVEALRDPPIGCSRSVGLAKPRPTLRNEISRYRPSPLISGPS